MYKLESNAFDRSYLNDLEKKILSSPFTGHSPLGPEFVRTKGFSVVFRREFMDDVIEKLPYLKPFLDKAVFPSSNAFYINPLILKNSSRVDTHVDCRFVESENVRIIPNLVSILYVKADDDISGGEIDLAGKKIIKPKTGDLLHFKGDTLHHVNEVKGSGIRVNIVCEQYNLPDDILSGFPEFEILTDKDPAPRVRSYIL